MWILLATLAADVASFAQGFVPPTPSGFVNDFANVVDAESANRMETMARNFRDRTQIDVAVVTLPSLQGRPIEEVGLNIGRQWGIGAGQDKNGLLILIAIEDRKSRIEVSRHLEDEITDGTSGAILREARPYLQQNQYGPALQFMLESVLATIAEKQGISIDGIDQSRAVHEQQQREPSHVPWSFIVFFIVIVLVGIFRNFGGGGRGG